MYFLNLGVKGLRKVKGGVCVWRRAQKPGFAPNLSPELLLSYPLFLSLWVFLFHGDCLAWSSITGCLVVNVVDAWSLKSDFPTAVCARVRPAMAQWPTLPAPDEHVTTTLYSSLQVPQGQGQQPPHPQPVDNNLVAQPQLPPQAQAPAHSAQKLPRVSLAGAPSSGGQAAVGQDAAAAAATTAPTESKSKPSNSFEKIMLRLSTMYPNLTRYAPHRVDKSGTACRSLYSYGHRKWHHKVFRTPIGTTSDRALCDRWLRDPCVFNVQVGANQNQG